VMRTKKEPGTCFSCARLRANHRLQASEADRPTRIADVPLEFASDEVHTIRALQRPDTRGSARSTNIHRCRRIACPAINGASGTTYGFFQMMVVKVAQSFPVEPQFGDSLLRSSVFRGSLFHGLVSPDGGFLTAE
jgi:hypothetical protein